MKTFLDNWHRGAAWMTCAGTIALLIVALVLHLKSPPGSSWIAGTGDLALLNPFISVVVGAIIIDRRGNYVIGWLFCLSGLWWAIALLGGSYFSYLSGGGRLPLEDQVLWTSNWASFVAFGMAPVLVVFVFPTGRLVSRRWRWFFATAVGAIALGVMGYAFTPGPMEDLPSVDNPYGVGGAVGATMTVLSGLAWPLLLASIAAGVWSLRERARGATLEERERIKWMLLAGITLVAFVAFWGVMDITGRPTVAAAFSGLFLPLIPISVGIAILRHRLYDIDLLINRTLVYASVSAVLAFVYLGTVVLLQSALSPLTAESDVAIAASTLAVAALFRPLRSRIQHFIDRRFYRRKYDAAFTLEQFSSRLRDQIDLRALTDELLAVVGETLQPSYAGVWLKDSEATDPPTSAEIESSVADGTEANS